MFVLKHGKLDNFSCFRYENYLQDLKKSIKSIKYPLQEIFNRILESQKISNELPSQLFSPIPSLCNEIIHRIPLPFFNTNDVLFEKIILPYSNTSINIKKEKDKYLMLTNSKIVSVQHIIVSQNKPACLIVKQFLSFSEFTTVPLSSFKIGVYIIDTTKMSELFCVNLTEIKYKCFFIRLSNNLALITSLNHAV
ncbi:unnamed protein product [Macrosiphum euphorbiae]|uniref:Uncharacterized protein n=1 Tax=Macrosiphum euphorbiae TaxID=13131 RepID=A0AAV0Y910_9HEMI|nr:unnamed protein product [Macrosiphum euphorbiae]